MFGSGNYLGLELNTSKLLACAGSAARSIPYFTIDGVSRAIDIYYRTSRPLNSLGEEYQLATPGASVRFGVPFSEFDTVFFGIGVERTEIKGTNSIPNAYFIYRDQYGADQQFVPAHDRLGTRPARQRRSCRRSGATRVSTWSGPRSVTCVICAPTFSSSSTSR